MKISFSVLSVAFFVLFTAGKLSAQNLVPNPSFEDTFNCYTSLGWDSFRGTTDYFNPCDPTGFQNVPTNMLGIQNPATGLAYSGILNSYFPFQSYREIIGSQLIAPLISGNKYYASIKISFADSSDVASNKIGISFSTVLYNYISAPTPIENQGIIYSTIIITDTTNWIIISGEFIADSSYNYIIIGNFFDDASTSTITGLSNQDFSGMSYYYIDDVCVSSDSLECDLTPEGIYNLMQQQIAIYPNPATEQLIIDNGQLIIKGIELFDLVGRKMMDDEMGNALLVKTPTTSSKHYTINTKNFPSGYYFIRINTSEGMINRKIVLL